MITRRSLELTPFMKHLLAWWLNPSWFNLVPHGQFKRRGKQSRTTHRRMITTSRFSPMNLVTLLDSIRVRRPNLSTQLHR